MTHGVVVIIGVAALLILLIMVTWAACSRCNDCNKYCEDEEECRRNKQDPP